MALIYFFEICRHIAHSHVLQSISHLLVASRLFTLDEQLGNIQAITIGEVIYQLVIRTLVIQFNNIFVEHFSPHQFGVPTLSGCKTITIKNLIFSN
jgi:hypothetical protein